VKGLSIEQYEEYLDIISSINALKYLEAKNKFFLAVEQDKDMETIEALQMELDRLEALKPKSSNLILSVEQVMSKIELFIQTHNIPRAIALAANRDMNGLRAFRELIAKLKKHLEELSPKIDSFVGGNMIAESDRQEKQRIKEGEQEKEKIAESDLQEELLRLAVDQDSKVSNLSVNSLYTHFTDKQVNSMFPICF